MTARRFQRGQVAVETALTMPLFVFLILGIIQLGLMHQARLMAKYAAYKAVRAGSLNRGDLAVMKRAALSVLLPMVTRDSANSGVYRIDSATSFGTAYQEVVQGARAGKEGAVDIAEIKVCNPIRNLGGANGSAGAMKPTVRTDFDDPRQTGWPTNDAGWEKFGTSRLAIQVTFHFRMIIPFANSILWRIVAGTLEAGTASVVRMNASPSPSSPSSIDSRLTTLASAGKYVLPIRASYGMRMYSNFSDDFLTNVMTDDNTCKIPWKKWNEP